MTQHVSLTIEPWGPDIAALCLSPFPDRLEARIDCSEGEDFFADCIGLDRAKFDQGYGQVVHMLTSDWQSWLDGFALVEENEAYTAAYLAS